jgi:hypothetical protein
MCWLEQGPKAKMKAEYHGFYIVHGCNRNNFIFIADQNIETDICHMQRFQ